MAPLDPLLRDFRGRIIARGDPEHPLYRYQYASSSVRAATLDPGLILVPDDTEDVRLALRYAERRQVAVALRTGGHQLSGASSTSGDNLLLDLRSTWPGLRWSADGRRVRVGVSRRLSAFQSALAARGAFLPHGQCAHVGLGGHVQTGGSGMMARGFGLLSDHVTALRLILADGSEREVSVDPNVTDDLALARAVLGGCPGSFGILQEVELAPLRDADHPHARALKFLAPYRRDRLERLLEVFAQVAADEDLAADHDLTVTVLGAAQWAPPWARSDHLDERMRAHHPEHYGEDGHAALPACIAVYAQWSNLEGAGQAPETLLFRALQQAAGYGRGLGGRLMARWEPSVFLGEAPMGLDPARETPLSEIQQAWMYHNVREYCLPYVKRVFLSDRTDLARTGWAQATAAHFDALVRGGAGLKGLLQVQHLGGRRSRYRTLGERPQNGHPWRAESTQIALVDAFYPPDPQERGRRAAEAWQAETDRLFLGEKRFTRQDRRLWWGSYGETSLERVKACYVPSEDRWEELRRVQAQVDPAGRFAAGPLRLPAPASGRA